MAKYNFYLSYSHRDRELAQSIFEALTVQGYTVFIDTGLAVGLNWTDAIAEAIASSDCFIPVITDAFLSSQSANMELNYAVSLSQGRAQAIFPLYFSDQPLPPSLKLLLFAHSIRYVRQPEDLTTAIDSIDRAVCPSGRAGVHPRGAFGRKFDTGDFYGRRITVIPPALPVVFRIQKRPVSITDGNGARFMLSLSKNLSQQ